MIKTFFKYLFFSLYLEFILHIACFESINFMQIILVLMFSIMFSVIQTFIISFIKKDKFKKVFFILISIIMIIMFGSELVYFKIYESFFNLSGIAFIGALKDGYDKILLTIFQNIIYIVLFIIPIVLFFKKSSFSFSKFNRKESYTLLFLFVISFSYSSFIDVPLSLIFILDFNSLYLWLD